jgi:hypothetical protein
MHLKLAFAILALYGLAADAQVSPSALTAIETAEEFRVPAVMKYTERRGIGIRLEQGLQEGTYTAKYQDETGIYFLGPEAAICQGSPPCTAFQHEGGIWVSKENPEDIRLFLIQELTEEQSESIAEFGLAALLANIGKGKYYLFPLNRDFAKQLAGTRTGAPTATLP